MRSRYEGVRNTVMAALLLVTLLLGAQLAEGAVNAGGVAGWPGTGTSAAAPR